MGIEIFYFYNVPQRRLEEYFAQVTSLTFVTSGNPSGGYILNEGAPALAAKGGLRGELGAGNGKARDRQGSFIPLLSILRVFLRPSPQSYYLYKLQYISQLEHTTCHSTRCRSSHTKCDEKRPRCGRCQRLELECQLSDFIIPSNWNSSSSQAQTIDLGARFPVSTWDIFNNTSTPLGNALPPIQSIPSTKSPSPPTLDAEKVTLLQEYQNGVGTWVSLFDSPRYLTHTIVKRALGSPLLLNAICALTARQMSMAGRGDMWKTTAVHYYGESLHHLIHMLNGPSYGSDDTLAATVLLSSYELFTSPGLDHRRHVSGAKAAAFWVYARQDVAMALVHECPTMLLPDEWGVEWTDEEMDEDSHTFGEVGGVAEHSLRRDRLRLVEELETWRGSLPPSFAGIPFAHLLLLTEGRNPSLAGEISPDEVDKHARSVASIASSPISDASLVQAGQPLYYSKHISTIAEKFRMWTLLDGIENRLGFHTGHRIKQLQQQFKLI
ncbi:hypothetical protein BDQ94DRAFT_182064 [Aspergillus welwitschiae]|uniref:Zn(2)-C6 fungal-type domain-containing protein n=1 Tax=Aspergillus welwitschiae TaxID=1341132 RepID=A0A3F3PU07_9EURO|nr:hypothetical protein BDQ94DRAFT_182064 [Aspergillus welwitschiae]RDH29776.1 hypothetical protein BDQ94DRAFT_182064 [Aspergillus welwitschiae]